MELIEVIENAIQNEKSNINEKTTKFAEAMTKAGVRLDSSKKSTLVVGNRMISSTVYIDTKQQQQSSRPSNFDYYKQSSALNNKKVTHL